MDAVAENRILRNRYAARLISDLLMTSIFGLCSILLDGIGIVGRLSLTIAVIITSSDIGYSLRQFLQAYKNLQGLPPKTKFETAEDRLDELERLKRRDMVTP
jgi:hypothetical protein